MKIIINPAYERFSTFVNTISERFDKEGKSIYKSRNEIKVFDVAGTLLNVKQYKVPAFANRVIYSFFRPAKAFRAYDYALKLLAKGFDTPEPVAYILSYKGGLIHRTYFISFQSSYPRNMYEFGEGVLVGREHIIQSLGRYTARLHEANIYHHDYSPGNILFNEADNDVSFCLIDINRMSFGAVSIKKGCANFARLWGNEEMFHLLAYEYAKERNADIDECKAWILNYRERFWEKYKKKHGMPFSL